MALGLRVDERTLEVGIHGKGARVVGRGAESVAAAAEGVGAPALLAVETVDAGEPLQAELAADGVGPLHQLRGFGGDGALAAAEDDLALEAQRLDGLEPGGAAAGFDVAGDDLVGGELGGCGEEQGEQEHAGPPEGSALLRHFEREISTRSGLRQREYAPPPWTP